MATNFPGALDTTTELPNNKTDNSTMASAHPSLHNNLSDAVIAIETELGTNPSGASSTVGDRIAAVEGAGSVPSAAVDYGQAGQWVLPFPFGSLSTHATPGNQIICVRFIAVKTRTVLGIDYEVHSSVAGGDIYVSLWNSAGTTLHAVSAEQVDQAASTGQKRAPFASSFQIVAGTEYYAGIQCSGTCTLRAISVGNVLVSKRWGATLGLIDFFGDNRATWTAPTASLAVDDATLTTFPLLSLYE